ncbi:MULTISPECIES: hypothetical protein [Cyclobacteriaceae]|nr:MULTISPECIES: hypothetical protein [Cyclobacteriaceae]MBB6325363.1 hypothetical protein [Algoriphagus iocasae]MBD3629827.1 hypothetical protein [Cyclobacterium sp.]
MALTISIISLIISGLTFWLTRIRKGSLKMTRPSIICFLGQNGNDEPKIFIRTLLYATADQGQHIQNMFVKIHRAETIQNFNVWAYGDNGIVRGSGLFASKTGISVYHHFLLPKNEQWNFVSGEYRLEVYAETPNNKTEKLFEQKLSLTTDQTKDIELGKAVYFDWAPNTGQYVSYSDIRTNEKWRGEDKKNTQ